MIRSCSLTDKHYQSDSQFFVIQGWITTKSSTQTILNQKWWTFYTTYLILILTVHVKLLHIIAILWTILVCTIGVLIVFWLLFSNIAHRQGNLTLKCHEPKSGFAHQWQNWIAPLLKREQKYAIASHMLVP